VLGSRREGGPYVPLEAMRAGRPVVATRVVGLRDVVVDGETGFLCEPGAVAEAADQVLALLDDDAKAAAMGAAGRERFLARYTIDAMVAAVRQVYEQAVATSGR
jgi:glycosyltransferase involved in cell wall biosynthesis